MGQGYWKSNMYLAILRCWKWGKKLSFSLCLQVIKDRCYVSVVIELWQPKLVSCQTKSVLYFFPLKLKIGSPVPVISWSTQINALWLCITTAGDTEESLLSLQHVWPPSWNSLFNDYWCVHSGCWNVCLTVYYIIYMYMQYMFKYII